MIADEFLIPDRRWEIWKCYSHQEYLDRFFIPGRWHKEVPEKVQEAYISVERLFAYSYFYYPLTEEVHSKMTRVFEMAVRIKADQLGITFKKKHASLQDHFDAFHSKGGFGDDMIPALEMVKNLRNVYAHPKSQMYFGPIIYRNVIVIINIINRLFLLNNEYNQLINKALALIETMNSFITGVFVFEGPTKRYLVSRLQPLLLSPDGESTLWVLDPVLKSFPKTMEGFSSAEPFFMKLKSFTLDGGTIEGVDLITNTVIRVYPTSKEADLQTAKRFAEHYASADLSVKDLHEKIMADAVYDQMERFVYDEYWNQQGMG